MICRRFSNSQWINTWRRLEIKNWIGASSLTIPPLPLASNRTDFCQVWWSVGQRQQGSCVGKMQWTLMSTTRKKIKNWTIYSLIFFFSLHVKPRRLGKGNSRLGRIVRLPPWLTTRKYHPHCWCSRILLASVLKFLVNWSQRVSKREEKLSEHS